MSNQVENNSYSVLKSSVRYIKSLIIFVAVNILEFLYLIYFSLREYIPINARNFGIKSLHLVGRRKWCKKAIRDISYLSWRSKQNVLYRQWLRENLLTSDSVDRMKCIDQEFLFRPKISILTPVYNVGEVWLRKAIDSVRNQIYTDWELCLINDASTEDHIITVLDEYALLDNRIRVKHLPKNVGIARASAQALKMARGDFVGLLDHDDEISLDALFHVVNKINEEPETDFIYTDEDKITERGQRRDPFFKPDWSPDLLLSMNYITHLSVFRSDLLEECGGFREGFDGSQDYDLLLRATERAKCIRHIPKILYHWRIIPESAAASTSAKPYAYESAKRALEEAIHRRGREGVVEMLTPGIYRTRYHLPTLPLVSFVLLVSDGLAPLRRCLQSFARNSEYQPFEILVVGDVTLDGLREAMPKSLASRCTGLLNLEEKNMAAMYNIGAKQANGDYLVFWDTRTELISPDWIRVMVEQAHAPGVGAVGCKRVDHVGRICDAGVVLGIRGFVGYAFKGLFDGRGYHCSFSNSVRNSSALSIECLLVPTPIFSEMNGFDEQLENVLFDIDFCLRVRNQGYWLVWTPYTVRSSVDEIRKEVDGGSNEASRFLSRWSELLRNGDPYYNPNLTSRAEDWSIKVGHKA